MWNSNSNMEHPYRPFDEDTDFAPPPPPSVSVKPAANSKLNKSKPQQQQKSAAAAVGMNQAQNAHLDNNSSNSNAASAGGVGNKVRLRAIESESEYFLKLMNVTVLRWLILVQSISTGIIFVSQILLYANATRSFYKPVDYIGIGIWGPLFFFSVASGMTWLSTKNPSGCSIGTAMGFQITTSVLASFLLLFSIISLIMHGRFSYMDSSYDPEVAGRVFCSFMILAAGSVIITSVFTSVHFCRAICCGRQRTMESIMFDVETLK